MGWGWRRSRFSPAPPSHCSERSRERRRSNDGAVRAIKAGIPHHPNCGDRFARRVCTRPTLCDTAACFGRLDVRQAFRNRPGITASDSVQPVIASAAKQSPAFRAPARRAGDCFAVLAMTGWTLSEAVIPGRSLNMPDWQNGTRQASIRRKRLITIWSPGRRR